MTSSEDKTICFIGKKLGIMRKEVDSPVISIAQSKTGEFTFTGHMDRTITVWSSNNLIICTLKSEIDISRLILSKSN